MLNNVKVVNAAQKMTRRPRTPSHNFNIDTIPFAISPFLIAPVLPGETLKNFSFQSRCVTKPLTSKLIGWWLEHYFFYVPFSAMKILGGGGHDFRDTLKAAMLSPDAKISDPGGVLIGSDYLPAIFHAAGGVNFIVELVRLIVERYFRDEGEGYSDAASGAVAGRYLAQCRAPGWVDSLALQSGLASYDETLTVGADDSFTMSELETLQRAYHFQVLHGLTDMTYEDFLMSAGVKVPGHVDVTAVELLRFTRSWQYPSNTVDPTDGSVSSAVSWSIAERADKDRYFKEPGFVVGVTVPRPKVYYGNQTGSVAEFMDDAFSWLPAVMQSEQGIGIKKFAAGTGPLPSQTGAYWLDLADVLMYGDQFLSIHSGLTKVGYNKVSLPSADLSNKRFATGADIAALFVGGVYTATGAGSFNAAVGVEQDGIVKFNIMSTLQDTTTGVFKMPMLG